MSSEEPSSKPRLQSPFFRATQAGRYERQDRIYQYEQATGRSLIVFYGRIEKQGCHSFRGCYRRCPTRESS